MRINISENVLTKLREASASGFVGTAKRVELEDYPHLKYTIELSDEVCTRLETEYEDSTDCTFDEAVWQYDVAIKCLLDRIYVRKQETIVLQ
jgi:hypothetical protein